MKKSRVLKTLLAISFCYLVVQFIILSGIFNKKPRNPEFIQSRKDLLEALLGQCQEGNIPLFLLELDVLQKSESSKHINKFLYEREWLSFGVVSGGNTVNTLENHQNSFEELGFTFSTISSKITVSNGNVVTLLTHVFLTAASLTVHIVVFYKKTETTLWFSGVLSDALPPSVGNIDSRPFIKFDGIFDRFELVTYGEFLVPFPLPTFLEAVPNSRFVQCNYTRTRQFLAKHPQDDSEEAKKFQRKARQLIARAKQYLDDLGISFWLSSGTCLGWYRQCDIITYSKDVDFGIWIKDFKPELIPLFERGGFFLKHVFGKVSDSYELSFQAGDIKLDLFFFYEETGHMWNGGTHHETGQKYKYSFPKFTMCWTVFLELKIRVPCPPEPYIEANYGKNWMEPVKHWKWNKSPPNVVENGFWPKEEWEDVIQVYW